MVNRVFILHLANKHLSSVYRCAGVDTGSFESPPMSNSKTLSISFSEIMSTSKRKQTILVNIMLASIGVLVSFWTGLIFFVPILFGLGLPLVNIVGPLKKKVGLTFVIVLTSTAIFLITALTVIHFEFDKYFFPGLLSGLAGVLILAINGLLIENVKLNAGTLLSTFILAGLSLPVWIFLSEYIFTDKTNNTEPIRQFGLFLLWMVLTTFGISFSVDKKPTTKSG